MKYETEEIEQIKKEVEEFLKNGPFGNIYERFEGLYPYRQKPERLMDGLEIHDVRMFTINFLYEVERGKGFEATTKTEILIQRIWDISKPDKKLAADSLKRLAGDVVDLIYKMDFWEWEELRNIGEVRVDIVRKTYQALKDINKRNELANYFWDFMEEMGVSQEIEQEIKAMVVRIDSFPQNPDMSILEGRQETRCISKPLMELIG